MISNVLIVLSNTMLDAVNNAQRDNGYPSEVSWDLAPILFPTVFPKFRLSEKNFPTVFFIGIIKEMTVFTVLTVFSRHSGAQRRLSLSWASWKKQSKQ